MTAFTPVPSSASRTVTSLYVIYDADGTRTGELVYILKKLLGISHCAACDITHGMRCEKPEFTEFKASWGIPVHNIHRDEMDDVMAATVAGILPCVVARTETKDRLLLGPAELEECAGDVCSFENAVNDAIDSLGLDVAREMPVCELRIQHPMRRKIVERDFSDTSDDAVVPKLSS